MRRWIVIFAVFALFAAAAFVISEHMQAPERHRRELLGKFGRIQIGMTKDEVLAILGSGARDNYDDPVGYRWSNTSNDFAVLPPDYRVKHTLDWWSAKPIRGYLFQVIFDDQLLVIHKWYVDDTANFGPDDD
jgi:hypothetical protein